MVVDRSASMDKWKPLISKLFDKDNSSAEVYITGNNQSSLIRCKTSKELKDIDFSGGSDNIPALRKALLLAKENKQTPSSILWIHGPQPIKFDSLAGLEQDLERTLSPTPIYSIALEDGANTVLEAMKSCVNFKGGSRVVNETDLIHMIQEISESHLENQYTWRRSSDMPLTGASSWDQLARKWAYENTMRHLKEPDSASLAAHYQLVTALSGAVVLETAEQYLETGLEIPDNQNMPALPAVPEPSSVLLLGIGAFMAIVRRDRSL